MPRPVGTGQRVYHRVSRGWLMFSSGRVQALACKGVVVAVIDTGLDLDNAALTQNISSLSWNFVANNQDVQDDNGRLITKF